MADCNVLVTVPQPLRDQILSSEALDKLQRIANVTPNESGSNWTEGELAARLPGVDVLLGSWGMPKLTDDVLASADCLKMIAYAAGSVKYFVTEAVAERDIIVCHAASRIAESVAEFSLLMAMMGLRRPHEFDRRMKEGEAWPKSREMALYEIAGKKVGLLGMGYVGRRSARLFRAVDAAVWAYDPYLSEEDAREIGVTKVGLDELIESCKVISIHLPVTEETHHLLGARELGLIQDGTVLINTARAWVVDQDALVAELAKGRFWAALDVYDTEPLPEDHPLRDLDNAFLTPHVAGLSRDSHGNLMAEMIDEIERFLQGEPLQHRVDLDQLRIMA